MTPRARFAIWAGVVAGAGGGQLLWIGLLRGDRILADSPALWIGHLLLGLLLVAMLLLLATTPAGAIRLSRQASHAIILVAVGGMHLAALVLIWPGLSDDLVRYRLDGRMWLSGVSPYSTAPEEYLPAHQGDTDSIDRMVTYRHMQTIYPPVAQLAFITSRGIEAVLRHRLIGPPPEVAGGTGRDAWRLSLRQFNWLDRGGVFRVMMSAAAVVWVAVALRLLSEMGRSPWWATLIAWHPLVVMETAGQAHIDIVGMLLLTAMLLDAHRGRWLAAALLLGLSCCIKPHAIVLLPFLLRSAYIHQAHVATVVRVGVVCIGVVAALYVPAMALDDGWRGWLMTVRTYSRHWEANGSVYELLKHWIGGDADDRVLFAKGLGRALGVVVLIAAGRLLWKARASLAEAGYWLMLVMLLMAPVVYPWYLLWAIGFVPFISARSAAIGMTWAATVGISYLVWHQPTWTLPLWASLVQYGPIYLGLALVASTALIERASAKTSPAAFPTN